MSLDQNLFTLHVKPSETDPSVVDLVDPTGNIFYRKQRIAGPVYATRVYDFVSQSLLVTATAPSASSKVKILELRNPSVPVELKSSGTFTVKWTFRWEEHEFEWKREECYMIRKPDPPVLVAITKEIPGRVKSAAIQVLDYNLNRFDIEDRKGLELVILTALLTFLDSTETNNPKDEEHASSGKKSTWTTLSPFAIPKVPSTGALNLAVPAESGSSSPHKPLPNVRTRTKSSPSPSQTIALTPNAPPFMRHSTTPNPKSSAPSSPPTPPPTPPPAISQGRNSHAHRDPRIFPSPVFGVDFVAQLQALRSVVHEVTVHEEGAVEDYAKFCWRLLKDEAMCFITVRSGSSAQVQKVLEVVEATKRIRFQRGPFIELLQFVTYYPLPVGTSRQKLEERIRLASMTPKEAKKAQKQQEKEEKNRKKKEKKGKGRAPADTLKAEDLEIPPKSVHVRLTKVELQQKISTFSSSEPKKVDSIDDKGKVSSHNAEDPRFVVQLPPSEVPSKFYLPEKGKRTATARDTPHGRMPLEDRRAVSEIWSVPHSLQMPVPTAAPGSKDLLRLSASQPVLSSSKTPHSDISSSSNTKSQSLSGYRLQGGAGVETASKAHHPPPPFPPRQSNNTINEKPIAGPSRRSIDQAPPSYAELTIENEIAVDTKRPDGM